MEIILDYYNNEFRTKNADFSKVKPFSHADVIINCDQPLSRTTGPLEREIAVFLEKKLAPFGIRARWDHSSEWIQSQRVEEHELPHISRLKMGVNCKHSMNYR